MVSQIKLLMKSSINHSQISSIETSKNNNRSLNSNPTIDSDMSLPKILGQKESGIPKTVGVNIYKCQVCQKEF